jgi:hypothetical protein
MVGASHYPQNVKRLLVFLIIACVAGAAVIYFLPSSNKSSGQTATQAAPKVKVHVKPWDGTGVRNYNAAFIHSGQSLDLISVRFSHLNRALATVSILLSVPGGAASKHPPRYIQSHYFAATAPDGTSWSPTKTTSLSGADIHIHLLYRNIPSRAIGVGLNSQTQAIEVSLPRPGGSFQVALVPPTPPAGHTFAEHPVKPKHSAKHPSKKHAAKKSASKKHKG